MAQKSPNAVEVLDIQFKLYSKIKISNVGEKITDNINLIAVSSTQGLLFAGDPLKPELKSFMLNNLIDTEHIYPDVLARAVPLAGVPNIVACSCDGSMLAVSYTQNGSSFLAIYNVNSFLTSNINVLHTIRLSPEENVSVLQILWNPVIAGNLAIVLSNGSLGMFNLKDGGQYEMYTLDKSRNVQCGCWSPKGKQIVLGLPNGNLQQFKPDLTPVKIIACPAGIHSGPFSTIAVHWLSTFQFATAFVQDGEDMIPSLYIVNAPKSGTPSYINYFDICYSTGQRPNQLSFTHVQQWNLLLVISANGIEMGLLGCREVGDTPTWVQYTLLDEARIELPLTESKDETFPAGFALDTSCTHQLTMNEKQLPIMPMIHVLSTNGQLMSFNFLNLVEGAVNICSPPPPISYNTQQYRPLDELLEETAATATAQKEIREPNVGQNQQSVGGNAPALLSSTPLIKDKPPQFFGNIGMSTPQSTFEQPVFGGLAQATVDPTQAIAAVKPTVGAFMDFSLGNANMQNAGLGGQPKLDQQQQSFQVKPEFATPQQQQQQKQQPQVQQQKPQQPQSIATAVVSGVKSSELSKPLYTVPPNFTPPTTMSNTQQMTTQKSQINAAVASKVQTGFLELIAVQINAFDKEIKQLANQSQGLLKNLGNPDEMKVCTKRLNDLQEIIEQANDHEFEMDVQNLRHFLNEARAMIAECRWKLEKYNNPDLPRLGNNTTDPVNRRQLVKLQQYVATNETQMQLLRQQIDAQWSNFQDSVRRNTKSQIHIPCLDGIYERMTKLQETLTRQRQKLNQLKMKLQQNGLLYRTINNGQASIGYLKGESTMDSLADSILSMTLAPVVDENRSKLSSEKLSAIRAYTRQRHEVNIIKAHRPNRVGLNSEVILETILQSERNKAREANAKVEEIEQKTSATDTKATTLPKPTASKPLLISLQPVAIPSLGFNNASSSFVKTTEVKSNVAPNLNFKPQLSMGGFSLATTNAELGKLQSKTPEEETPAVAQIPISFAAKVIGGTANALSKSATTTFAPTTTANSNASGGGGLLNALPNQTKTEVAAKPFSFNLGTATAVSSPGFFSGLTSNTATTTKPSSFDVKSGTGFNASFSFGGFTSGVGSVATTATPSSAAPAPILSVAPTTTVLHTTKSSPSIFSGFGKSIGVEGPAVVPQNPTASIPTSSVLVQNLTKSPQAVTPLTTTATSAASISTADSAVVSKTDSEKTDSTDTLFGNVNICKPTTKTTDASKPATTTSNIFAGFGTGTTGAGFSFASTTGSSFSFADLTKSLSTTTAATTTTATTVKAIATPTTTPSLLKPISTATTPAVTTNAAASNTVPTPGTVKTSDFSFSLSELSSDVATPTTSTPVISTTIPSIAATITAISTTTITPIAVPTTTTTAGISIFATSTTAATTAAIATTTASTGSIFANVALPPATAASTNKSIFGGSNTSFLTSATTAVTTTTTTSSTGSIFGVAATPASTAPQTSLTSTFVSFGMGAATSTDASTTPTSGASIFAAAAATTPPPSGAIFGGIPKPDQSVFGGSPAQAPTAAGGGSIFATAAANTSPFGNVAVSSPPNQTVSSGGSIFGGGATFAKPPGTIFGGGAPAAAPQTGSPFGAPVAATPATGGSIFGGATAAKPTEGASIFGGVNAQPPASTGGGSIFGQTSFGQPTAASPPSNNLFGSVAPAPATQSAFGGGGSIFGGGGAAAASSGGTSGGSIFGGGSAAVAPSSFGSPANTGSTGFGGAFSQSNVSSPFSSPSTGNSPFAQGGASVAQSGFGSPQQQSAFSKPIFGGPPTFGSPPAFGAQPTFGGGATFGSQKPFGSFSSPPTSPPTGMFAAAAQKNNLFETLGSSDSGLSFGNLAQGANANVPKPTFGGSSFTSYRS